MRIIEALGAIATVAGLVWSIYLVNMDRLRRKWSIVPRSVGDGRTAVFLERGDDDEIQVGEPFPAYDEVSLDEHLLDAERMRRHLAKRN
jgi:hypothetical protein